MKTSDFDYHLPPSAVAQHPLPNREESRLLVLGKHTGRIQHRRFSEIIDYLGEGDVLVRNDTKVFPARVHAKKTTGATVEFLLIEQLPSGHWACMVKPGRRARPGDVFYAGEITLRIVDLLQEGYREVKINSSAPLFEALERIGEIPLPPYIHEPLREASRYQTVFAHSTGSVAAPTAGLHFTEELLRKVEEKGCKIATLTLHVGPGTFRPVKTDIVQNHVMHAEAFEITSACAQTLQGAKRVIALGTTSLRTLEAAGNASGNVLPLKGKTDIFIYPGYTFNVVDALITNFHLPKSTLLMLVSAFSRREWILQAYEEALKERYRFFSFGDAMFITDQL
jgi:S-adenosylmethionine:tRNA ribosyltransferase-isomerase